MNINKPNFASVHSPFSISASAPAICTVVHSKWACIYAHTFIWLLDIVLPHRFSKHIHCGIVHSFKIHKWNKSANKVQNQLAEIKIKMWSSSLFMRAQERLSYAYQQNCTTILLVLLITVTQHDASQCDTVLIFWTWWWPRPSLQQCLHGPCTGI